MKASISARLASNLPSRFMVAWLAPLRIFFLLSSSIDSLNSSLVGPPELGSQISNFKTVIVEQLDFLIDYSRHLNVIPAYLILQGTVFVAVSLAIYFILPKEEKDAEGDQLF